MALLGSQVKEVDQTSAALTILSSSINRFIMVEGALTRGTSPPFSVPVASRDRLPSLILLRLDWRLGSQLKSPKRMVVYPITTQSLLMPISLYLREIQVRKAAQSPLARSTIS
jgi:multisubunit Na+/H+ antiporter MnhC subunit